MNQRSKAIALIQREAAHGILLNLSPEGLNGFGVEDRWNKILPEIDALYEEIVKVLKETEFNQEVNPFGVYEQLKSNCALTSTGFYQRLKALRDRGTPFAAAMRIAIKEEIETKGTYPHPPDKAAKNAKRVTSDIGALPKPRSNRSGRLGHPKTTIANPAHRQGLIAQQGEPGTTGVNPKDPYQAARNWLEQEFTANGLRYLHYWQGDFWSFRSSKYKILSSEDMRAQAYSHLAACVDPNGSPLQVKKALIDNFLDALRAVAKLPDTIAQPAFLDDSRKPSDYIACRNGLLHIATGRLHSSTPAFFNCNALDVDYDPSADYPRAFTSFLHSIWGSDINSSDTLQEFFGYFLTSDTSLQKGLMLIGPPRSGKGTIGRILARMLGSANTCAPTLATLGTQFGLQTLIGKPLAIISDARVSGRSDISAVTENLLRITGEDFVSIPRKFKDDYTARLPTRFLMMSNELPSLADSSGALASRFILLRLTRSFAGQEDYGLEERINAELSGILNWGLEGLERLKEQGHFIQPASAITLVEQLDYISSPIKEFLDDYCEIVPGSEVECQVLFSLWLKRCEEQNRKAGSIQTFGKLVSAALPAVSVSQGRIPGDRIRYYNGIRLRPQY